MIIHWIAGKFSHPEMIAGIVMLAYREMSHSVQMRGLGDPSGLVLSISLQSAGPDGKWVFLLDNSFQFQWKGTWFQ